MNINYNKEGLVPAIIQDAETKTVLMLGYMNEEALEQTKKTQRVTFFSRSKNRLWTKGEESGHYLNVISLDVDCDCDTLLIKALPQGPTCHKGTDNCWGQQNTPEFGFLTELEHIISDRKNNLNELSYVSGLFNKGINAMAQKVGEEAVEMVIEAKDANNELFLAESADLLFHYLILLQAKGYRLESIIEVLKSRH